MTKALLVRDLDKGIEGWEESDEFIVPVSSIREIGTIEDNPCILKLGFDDGTYAHIRVVCIEYFLQQIEWEIT